MTSFEYVIKDELGIHARPAGLLVKTAKVMQCKVMIRKGEKTVDAAKLFNVMSLGVKCGDTITISCDGDNEQEAANAIREFFEKNL